MICFEGVCSFGLGCGAKEAEQLRLEKAGHVVHLQVVRGGIAQPQRRSNPPKRQGKLRQGLSRGFQLGGSLRIG